MAFNATAVALFVLEGIEAFQGRPFGLTEAVYWKPPGQVSGRGLSPRLSNGTLQLSVRCSSAHLGPRRSLPVSTFGGDGASGGVAAIAAEGAGACCSWAWAHCAVARTRKIAGRPAARRRVMNGPNIGVPLQIHRFRCLPMTRCAAAARQPGCQR